MRVLSPPLQKKNNGAQSKHFRDKIRIYNSMFAFTSMSTDIVKDINKEGGGLYIFKICSQVHLMGSVLPPDGQQPIFAQFYVYDTQNELFNPTTAITTG